MEWSKTATYRTCVDPALEILEQSHEGTHGRLRDHSIPSTTFLHFKFFKMFFWAFDHWQVSEECDWHLRSLRSVTSTMGSKLRQTVEERPYQLEKRIEPFKRQAKEICMLLLSTNLRCKPCQQNLELFLEYGRETASFIEFVLDNLQALNFNYHLIAPARQQIDFITGKLKVFKKFGNPVSHSITIVKNLGELISQTRTWANHLSCLACLYWIDHGMDETLASTMGNMLSNLMQRTMPYTPGVVASYFESTLISQLLARYFDFLLEELVSPGVEDDIETLRERLIFLLSFMMDPPEEDSEDRELILGQIYSIINYLPTLICSIHSNEKKDWIFETKLSEFLQKIAGVEAEVRKLYAITPRSSQFNSPRTNAIGFLDSLLQKLKKCLEEEMNFGACVKHGIQTVGEELASLRPFMQHITEIQNEQEELKDLWTRIVDVVYYAAYVTSLCAAKSFSIWYGIICLSSVIEEIKVIKNEVREINDPQMYKSKMLSVELESRNTMLPRTTTSKVEGAFRGFKEDIKSIIDHLIVGRRDLTIISISGMPGQGKTTLAKRIYNDPKIQCHFDRTVWCYVSKECKIRDLMIYILQDVSKTDVEDISKAEIQDLAEKVRKSLKGRRYLIVMDDIWDVGVWCQVQSSFPDDRIGSRILFTSRNHNLKSQDNFISYPLRSFSDEESWDLMKEKLNGLDPEFVEIGKEIAKSCKGLPLAVALVASVLGKTEQTLELWNQVAKNLKSHLASEGCMHIIELSYKCLPEHLKSCFLYLGAFPRGGNIRAERLKLLWMAEGFIKENEMRCSEDLAEDCLNYLVSHSLVVVAERSSMGQTKTCNVHDLLYDLCLEKIAEDNFLNLIDGKTVRDECHSSPLEYAHHRLCIRGSDPFIEARPMCRRKELPRSLVQSLLWLDRLNRFSRWLDIFSDDYLISFLKSFKVLTVLDLEEVYMNCGVFPEVILCNIHLKYLALWGSIMNIPPSIAELWNVETLILRGDSKRSAYLPYYSDAGIKERRIPDTMWRMKSLRHVRIDFGCLSLEDFEGNESYMAAQQNIETLCGLILENDPRTVEFFGRMTRLRKLKCDLKGDVLHRTWFSIFRSLEKLEELKIRGYKGRTLLDLETCSSFLYNKNLRKLSLEKLELPSWSVMSTIGTHLPNLEVLKLWRLGYDWKSSDSEDGEFPKGRYPKSLPSICVGSRRWDLDDGEFSKLRYLKLKELNDLEEINVCGYDNPFPCLEVLVVERCWSLEEIPCSFGEICTLNTIRMSRCSRKASESVMQILKQQGDLGNHNLQVLGDNQRKRIERGGRRR